MDELSPIGRAAVTCAPEPREHAVLDEAPVLVAVDFSPHSEEALRWACDYAGTVGAPLEILHVVHDPGRSPGHYRSENGDILEPMTDVAQRRLEELLAQFRATHPDASALNNAKTICITGLPTTRILEVASLHGARMLVLGHRGHNELAALLLGSTSKQVARHAKIPVTIVRAKEQ